MSWLRGLRVLVTRAAHQSADLVDALVAAGAVPVAVPLLAIEETAAPDELEASLRRLRAAPAPRWIALTSANAAAAVMPLLGDVPAGEISIAAVGPATARLLTDAGIAVDVVAADHVAEGLVEALAGRGVAGAHIWIPVAEEARDALPQGLRALGASVEIRILYRTVLPDAAAAQLAEALSAGIDVITFTSGSAVRNFVRAGGRQDGRLVACIGEITASAARAAGMSVAVVATEHTVAGLVAALEEHCAGRERLP